MPTTHISQDLYRASFFLTMGATLKKIEWNDETSRCQFHLEMGPGMDADDVLTDYGSLGTCNVNLRTYLNHLFDVKRDASRIKPD